MPSNAINGTNVYVIYAQTPKFFIDGDACTDPPTSSCAPAATVTVTVSTTLSSSASATSTTASASRNGTSTYTRSSASSTVSSPSSQSPTTIITSSSHHHPKPTSGGSCPDTIGWGESGYDHPVTLTSAPTPPGGDSATATEYWASTSTIYSTIYKDLSEVDECNC